MLSSVQLLSTTRIAVRSVERYVRVDRLYARLVPEFGSAVFVPVSASVTGEWYLLVIDERATGTAPSVCAISITSVAPLLLRLGSTRRIASGVPNPAMPSAQVWSDTDPSTTPSTRSAIAPGFAAFHAFSMFVRSGWTMAKVVPFRQKLRLGESSG